VLVYFSLYYILVILLKNLFNCGYRSLRCALLFNGCSRKKVYRRLKFDNGVSMLDIRNVLCDNLNVSSYKLDDISYISSNMIVHTFYKGEGHFLYVIYASSLIVFLYDPRRVFSYRVIRRSSLYKFIDFRHLVRVLLIEEGIKYKKVFFYVFLEVIFICFAFMFY